MEEQLQSSWSKLLEKLSSWVDSVVLNLPNLLIALLIFVFATWVSRNIQSLTNRYLKKVIKQPSIRGLVSNVFAILIVVLGIILALSVLNLDGTLKSLLAGAGVAGLAVSLALQGTLSNTFSGLFIAIKDEMNIGDWVETNGYAGRVVEIDLRNTKIKEADNNIVVVPNRMIMEKPFKNYGLTKRIRTTITCGVGYESDLRKVKKVSIEAIENLYPPNRGENIEFYYTDFGNSSIDFLLRFWVDAQENLTALEVKSEAVMTIKETFDKHGINIPFPIRTVIQQNTNKDTEQDS
ncbi:small conductance mechanosensitive channel [Kordia periserrulae]|uniref:Small conductance mechanosensitive channel n=1 Tax=Kordia periserrulae TaxID=701523 RepID=A0A2T6C2Y0_9FLAO|nr:mechanosensitive ion channel family protein [Kordia periserrulae]PTX62671.1 small conductance mechanosensitive channel [Kordia periserrulae]